MANTIGDVTLNSKPFLLQNNGYRVSESPYSQGRLGQQGSQSHGDHYSYWSQTDWVGDGGDDWLGDGPFFSGYGLDLSTAGQIAVAKQLAVSQADASNTGGYVTITDGSTRQWFCGKTNGTAYYTTDGSAWTTAANTPAAAQKPLTTGNLKGVNYVSTDGGKLYSLAGTVFTEKTTAPLATAAYILGSYKSKLWIGYANALYYYDGAAWNIIAGPQDEWGCDLVKGWASSKKNAWLVGRGGCVFHWDGAAWEKIPSGVTDDIYGLHGSDPEHVWIAPYSTAYVLRLKPE